MVKKLLSTTLLGLLSLGAFSQNWNAARIQHEMMKVPQGATVLYIAAHPDDENTRLISWLANEKRYRTAYLSLTRGDGGQNLIGKELGTKLGVIRSNELTQARHIDGGEQYFTRAYDFGYSKTWQETLSKWNRDSLLSDMVYVIRKLKPNMIITRFSDNDSYRTHGHHTTSAILAHQAFDLAADANAYPEQLNEEGIGAWKTQFLMFNASTWWNPDLKAYTTSRDSVMVVKVSGYNPLLGESYTEIAGRSRSMHKSQGFGARRGVDEQLEYLILKKVADQAEIDPQSWTKVNPFEALDKLKDKKLENRLAKIYQSADFEYFKTSLTNIVNVLGELKKKGVAPTHSRLAYRIKQLERIIVEASGLYLRLETQAPSYYEGESLPFTLHAVNRNQNGLEVLKVSGNDKFSSALELNKRLFPGQSIEIEHSGELLTYSDVPWLRHGLNDGMFGSSWRNVATQVGTGPQFTATVQVRIQGAKLDLEVPLTYTRIDPVDGEVSIPILVQPKMTATLSADQLLFYPGKKSHDLELTIEWHGSTAYSAPLFTQTSAGFSVRRNMEREVTIGDQPFTTKLSLFADKPNTSGHFSISANMPAELHRVSLIDYPHIGRIQVLEDPKVELRSINASPSTKRIAYLQGAGDQVDDMLRNMGMQVDNLKLGQINETTLKSYDVLILGIRASNKLDFTVEHQEAMMQFMRSGGHVIVQYNTSRRLKKVYGAPYPLQLGRGRVTEEDATMTIINTEHPLLNIPNKLDSNDFKGWVQERGLYFADKYTNQYTPIFRSHDTGEDDLEGMLLVADYGSGSFIYTGISFFRQLPAGVPGAYNLFLNLIDYEAKP